MTIPRMKPPPADGETPAERDARTKANLKAWFDHFERSVYTSGISIERRVECRQKVLDAMVKALGDAL